MTSDVKTHKMLWLGIALGFIVFIIPLKWGPGRDPFDEGINYMIWAGGSFLSSMGLSIYRSKGVWKWALCVALGFPAAVIFAMLFGSRDYNLWPFTLALSLVIGLLPVFIGAYFGKLVRFVVGKIGDSSKFI